MNWLNYLWINSKFISQATEEKSAFLLEI